MKALSSLLLASAAVSLPSPPLAAGSVAPPLDCSSPTAASTIAIQQMTSVVYNSWTRYSTIRSGISIVVKGSDPSGGGGTNPAGCYFGPLFDASTLPSHACEKMKGGYAAECYPAGGVLGPDVADVTFQSILAETDAQVWYGCTPPDVQYWGMDTIITGRNFDHRKAPPLDGNETFPMWFPGVNFVDPVNSVNSGSGPGSPSVPMAIIITSDERVAKDLTDSITSTIDGLSVDFVKVVKLDKSVMRLVSGDPADYDSWKESMPDMLRHFFRASIPTNVDSFNEYQKSYFPFFHFGGYKGVTSSFEITRAPREVGFDESESVSSEWDSLSSSILSFQESSGYRLASDVFVETQELFGLYDDWDEFLASPYKVFERVDFPAGTRDGTYGFAVSNVTIGTGPMRLVVVGADHTKTELKASYVQVGINIFGAGQPITPESMPYSRWLSNLNLEPLEGSAEGSKLWYVEFALNGAKCSERAAMKDATCITDANDIAEQLVGGTVMIGTRAYALASTGVGPSKDEIFKCRMALFEEQTIE